MVKKKGEDKQLVELCSRASYPELHSLVEELHLRREENGIDLEDYAQQARLKELIHLIYRYGDSRVKDKSVDRRLLGSLKRAGAKIRGLEPSGLLRDLLRTLSVSWPELLTMFWALLAVPGMEKVLGGKLGEMKNYAQFNRLLYFLFAGRMIQQQNRKERQRRFLFSDKKVRRLVEEHPHLAGTYQQLRGRPGDIPLLSLDSEHWLLSPELLYDNLLENYAGLVGSYAQAPNMKQVSEGRSGGQLYLPENKYTSTKNS